MAKYRKTYFEIEKALQNNAYNVIILVGIRKTGKTTILKQLAESRGGYYLDFRASSNPDDDYLNIFERSEKLILLDEIGYLLSFDAYFGNLESDITSVGKKVVITSSSYGTLKQLSSESLGGGRSYTAELYPLCFEEYLYFSGVINNYNEEYEPTEQDLQNFYRLKNMPSGMNFIVDREYFDSVFTDIEVARANSQFAVRDIFLEDKHYASVLDVIAYTLNDKITIERFKGMTRVGSRELGKSVKGLPISESLISLAANIVRKMTYGAFLGIDVSDLAHIAAYLYHAGFLFVDLSINENGPQPIDRVMIELLLVKDLAGLEAVLDRYTFSVISPLLYTRLMLDLEDIAGKLCEKTVYGQLYELTVKCEDLYKDGYDRMHRSYKYKLGTVEVDLWRRNLLFEATVRDKDYDEHYVDKVAVDYQVIRILTRKSGPVRFNGVYYRIGYPKALLMLSNGAIYGLKAAKAIEGAADCDSD